MIHIVVDSTADLPAEVAAQEGVHVVPILVQFGRKTFKDTELSHDDFYLRLMRGAEFPSTAAPPVGMFEQTFRELTQHGDAVLSISLAQKLSSTFNAAQQAAQLLDDRQIVCVESGTTTSAYSSIALAAAQAARAGATMNELTALVERLKQKAMLIFGVDTLRYLEKGGRIGRVRAFLGTVLSVKPIIEVRGGDVLPVEQVRTSRRVPGRLIEIVKDRGRFATLSVLYTTGRAEAEALADVVAQTLASRNQITITQAGPALGTHAGPGALGISGLLV